MGSVLVNPYELRLVIFVSFLAVSLILTQQIKLYNL